jgi:hypothetical protein
MEFVLAGLVGTSCLVYLDDIGDSVNSGLDYWNGLLDWTTGLTFDLEFKS